MTHDTQVKQEAPERVFLKACHPASPNHNCTWSISKEPKDSVEYVRADLLATVRQDAREAALLNTERAVWVATRDFKGVLNEIQRRAIALAVVGHLKTNENSNERRMESHT